MDINLTKRVIEVISHVKKIPIANIEISQSLEELGMDSFDSINLLFALEEEFNITLPDEAREYKIIRDMILGIEQILMNQSALLDAE
jgi:acyl carrier protein